MQLTPVSENKRWRRSMDDADSATDRTAVMEAQSMPATTLPTARDGVRVFHMLPVAFCCWRLVVPQQLPPGSGNKSDWKLPRPRLAESWHLDQRQRLAEGKQREPWADTCHWTHPRPDLP